MSQITIPARMVTSICAVLLLVAGCGTPNDKVAFDADTQKHAPKWIYDGHAAAAQAQVASCRECHGEDLLGGISGVSCSECHPSGPTPMTGCISCHANPPAGTVAPDRAGAHATHYALPDSSIGCGLCHNGAGSGTASHGNENVDVVFLSEYSAKSGTAMHNADGTCSKVSCHGGQTTPAWLSGGTIDVNSQCLSCHAYGTDEYNGFSSGQHNYHVNTRQWNGDCVKCHDLTKLATVHFTSLSTTTLDGQAYLTLSDYVGYDKGTGKCVAVCHPTRRGWYNFLP